MEYLKYTSHPAPENKPSEKNKPKKKPTQSLVFPIVKSHNKKAIPQWKRHLNSQNSVFITRNQVLFYHFPHNFFTVFAISPFWATVKTISMGNHQKHRFSGDTLRAAKAGLLQQQHLENRIHQPDAVPSPNMSVLSASKNPQ